MITQSKAFRSVAESMVPEAVQLDAAAWQSVGAVIEQALDRRPAAVRRQLTLFMRILNTLSLIRHRRPLHRLAPTARNDLLARLERSRLLLLRRGIWGLRTLIFMGYYARPEARDLVGYRADARGWQAR